ncbi:hypothetical protein UNDYM_2604 [Undibacterium sp. YM2]|uniref:nuclear transport factor 2 family protein n=1 Tax=Undibacterium sp. YM2 TaxID=2058625 RepID=UPI001331D318|nr:nuclear transport factor 2 family protein [Undibacterium sp. YM2]BBB66857.1 hypothetical protein UNDYM_2604 [Undibacterium sp. YM2]
MRKIAAIALLSTATIISFANEPKEALADFHTALVAGDKAKASEVLAADVTIYESGYVERSRAEYAEHHMPGDMTFAKASKRSVLQQSQRIEGNLAVIWEETETKTKIGGKDVVILGTETALQQKTGDKWKIVHVHWSSRKPK